MISSGAQPAASSLALISAGVEGFVVAFPEAACFISEPRHSVAARPRACPARHSQAVSGGSEGLEEAGGALAVGFGSEQTLLRYAAIQNRCMPDISSHFLLIPNSHMSMPALEGTVGVPLCILQV